MAETLKVLFQSALPNTLTTHYTVPALTTTIVKTMSFCNTDATDTVNVKIYFVANGGTASTTNIIMADTANGLSILPGETVLFNPDHYLTAGFTIQISCSKTSVVGCTCSGVEMT